MQGKQRLMQREQAEAGPETLPIPGTSLFEPLPQ